VANLDRLAHVGQRVDGAALPLPCGILGAALALGLRLERVDPARLPFGLLGLDFGGGAAGAVDFLGDLEPCSAERFAGAGDDVQLRQVVAAVRHVPSGDAAPSAPAVGFQYLGGAVAPAGAVDQRSLCVGVGDGEHVCAS
jgi:hypothetical protein